MGEKLRRLLDFIEQLIADKKSGCLEINFSQGGITKVSFKEKIL